MQTLVGTDRLPIAIGHTGDCPEVEQEGVLKHPAAVGDLCDFHRVIDVADDRPARWTNELYAAAESTGFVAAGNGVEGESTFLGGPICIFVKQLPE